MPIQTDPLSGFSSLLFVQVVHACKNCSLIFVQSNPALRVRLIGHLVIADCLLCPWGKKPVTFPLNSTRLIRTPLSVHINPQGYVFIMGYVTFSLWCYMVYCSVASLAVGYIYLGCSHLYSFASYDRPYALKIKYPVTRGFS